MAHHSASTLTIDVEVARRVPQLFFRLPDRMTILREDGAGQGVASSVRDGVADGGEGLVGRRRGSRWCAVGGSLGGWRSFVVINVDAEDRSEELATHQVMVGVCGLVDCWVDEVALAIIVNTTAQQFKLVVVLSVVDGARELLEACFMNDGSDEVSKILGVPDLEFLRFRNKARSELFGERGGNVSSRTGTAFLTLIFKSATYGVDDRIVNIGGVVHNVEIFASSLANDTWVAAVFAFSNAIRYLAIQTAEDCSAASVVKG